MTTMARAQSPKPPTCLASAIDLKVSHDMPPKRPPHAELTRWAGDFGKRSNGVKR